MNILFICTSNQDRSPALEKYYREKMPWHEYKSAGVNKYFTTQKKTTYITKELINWADVWVFAEKIHQDVVYREFYMAADKADRPSNLMLKKRIILDAGNYTPDTLHEYLDRANKKLEHILCETNF